MYRSWEKGGRRDGGGDRPGVGGLGDRRRACPEGVGLFDVKGRDRRVPS